MIKYSIIIPFYNRLSLYNTLSSFWYHYKGRSDYEILIIEDMKTDPVQRASLSAYIQEWVSRGLPIRHFEFLNPGYMATRQINFGAQKANGEILLLTCPECYHQSNILSGLDFEFFTADRKYVVCACQNVSVAANFSNFSGLTSSFIGWYQHSVHFNRILHFCTAIPKKTFFEIGGFDEVYADGLWYDDDDFKETIKASGMPIIYRDDLISCHQDHSRAYQHGGIESDDLRRKNLSYYESKWKKKWIQCG